MRFSLFSVLDYYDDGSRTLSTLYTQLLDQIVEADHLGFEAFWIGEHHGYLTPHLALACPNPALVLAAAAQRTRRIGLNTAIANLSLRHPLLLAEEDDWVWASDEAAIHTSLLPLGRTAKRAGIASKKVGKLSSRPGVENL